MIEDILNRKYNDCLTGLALTDKGLEIPAGLDVYETEPPKDSPLLKLENVVLTPHIGANTKEGQIRAGTVCAEQIIKVLNGETPDFWVNRHLM